MYIFHNCTVWMQILHLARERTTVRSVFFSGSETGGDAAALHTRQLLICQCNGCNRITWPCHAGNQHRTGRVTVVWRAVKSEDIENLKRN